MAFKFQQTRKGILTLLIAAATVGSLSGCGGSGQDRGHVADTSQVIKGLALDGHLARAMVFADFDNNGTRGAWEPFAFTDDEGYFSFNPRTQTDYCTLVEYMDFCLRLERSVDEVVIRIDGGYDTVTGEPFEGQLSRRISADDQVALGNVFLVTPFSTLITSAKDQAEEDIILANVGITRADLDIDYLDRDGLGVNALLLNKALKLHMNVSAMARFVQDEFDEIGSAVGTPNDLTANTYANLAKLLHDQMLESILAERARIEEILQRTRMYAYDLYTVRDLSYPMFPPVTLPDIYVPRLEWFSPLVRVIDLAVPPFQQPSWSTDASIRAVEAVTIKMREADRGYTHVDSTFNFLLNNADDNLVEAFFHALDNDRADVGALVSTDFSSDDFSTSDGILNAVRLPSDVLPFRELAGKSLRVSDMDLGWAPYDLRDAEVEFYFDGNANSGQFDACVKYIDGASSDGRLGEANTRGELVHGDWSLLGAGSGQGESYSLILTIKYLNATYQAIMKPAGFELIDGIQHHKIRFDYANDYRTWHSADGMQSWSTLPTSNADCEQRLPSRIGI